MADTCIVCLGDLGEGGPDPALAAVIESLPRPFPGDAAAGAENNNDETPPSKEEGNPEDDLGKIAHLLPCGHNLHNECLKAWVERANSCPICRASFNVVEVTDKLGGPAITSYCVQDRVQVAEVDPSMLVEDLAEDSDPQPCPICGDDDNEDVLLLCDGCDVASHTYCVGLDSIPSGPWFCEQCDAQRAVTSDSTRPQHPPGRRTRGAQRRNRTHNWSNALDRARVWQRVWDQLNLDLDFPFDDEHAAQRVLRRQRREAAQRRDFRAWERRFEIARRQGGARAFMDTAPAILEMRRGLPSRPRPRIESPEPESVDEIRAWNAFERAREIHDGSGSNRLKRKSPSASPAEPEPQPERKLKRPRTRRTEALPDRSDRAESSRTGGAASGAASNRPRAENSPAGPSFLQSLLKEVEDSSAPGRNNGTHRSPMMPPTDMSSPRPSSPAQSPLSSNRSSPRPSTSTTPPPHATRPTSPSSVSSDPVFSSPEFSPTCSPAQDPEPSDRARNSRTTTRTQSAHHSSPSSSCSPSRARSNDTSPTRPSVPGGGGGLSLSIKSDLQKMVSTALKPHYRQNLVSKDEYTDINRRISRMLYDLVGIADSLSPQMRERCEKVAKDEVNKSVATMKETRANTNGHMNDASDSSGGAAVEA